MARNLRAAVALLAAAALLAAGCAKGSATRDDAGGGGGGKVTLRYFTFSAAPDHVKDLDQIVAAFEKENPRVDVRVETAPFEEYFTKLQTSLAGGTAPDTFELNYENFVTYAGGKALLDLGPVAAADKGYDPAAYQPSSLAAFRHQGRQFALPASFSTVVLFYNKDLFEKAGVPLPTADWTWEDEMDAARRLTDRKNKVYGDFQPVQFHEFYKTLSQAGGRFLAEDGRTPAFNGPEGVRAAEWLVGKVGKVMPTEAEIGGTADYDTNLFKSGKLAMWHNGIWQFAGLADAPFEWDVVVEPGDRTKASAVFHNAVAASARTGHPKEAWAWARFLTASKVAADVRIRSSWELPPVADRSLLAGYLKEPRPPGRQAVFDSLKSIALPPVIAKQQEMQDAVTEELGNAAAGRKSVKAALDDAARKVAGLL
ncbi:ABC transporter substrate-binding protein [Bailinhaonella thermotolerans]|uniref:Sugar ABC transporter substrate-binding protein n=1 Tax=Bailinhaonella thermotolerans TaxID=1070861 RepID=A0A3A4ARW0_9ACTN|nr:sugar ABC transporter substrate-binding protein [Bailinhaonella thermotolerans]RJL32598.1 sugar ABC transporter substrate-binding protein [Bailinhaonella thermotolerans]